LFVKVVAAATVPSPSLFLSLSPTRPEHQPGSVGFAPKITKPIKVATI
jgi:hypothetical protein